MRTTKCRIEGVGRTLSPMSHVSRMLIALALLLAMGIALPTPAGIIAEVGTDDGSGADARVIWGDTESDTNYGNNLQIGTRATSFSSSGYDGLKSKTYMRFDIASQVEDWQISKSYINSAALYLRDNYSTAEALTAGVFALNSGHAGENWSETGITWNNAPANIETGDFVSEDVTYLGELSFTSNGGTDWVSFSSQALSDYLASDADGIVTLMLSNNNNNNMTFAAKDRTDTAGGAPYLQIIPEPTTGALILIGLGVLTSRRRRQ